MNRVDPKPGQVWLHEHAGIVLIVRPWAEMESVCDTVTGRRVLRHEFLAAYLCRSIDGKTIELRVRTGEVVPVPTEDFDELPEKLKKAIDSAT